MLSTYFAVGLLTISLSEAKDITPKSAFVNEPTAWTTSKPLTSTENFAEFEVAQRPQLDLHYDMEYSPGATFIADFDNDGIQEWLSVNDPAEYGEYLYEATEGKISARKNLSKLKASGWRATVGFYDPSTKNSAGAVLPHKGFQIVGDFSGCLHPAGIYVANLNSDVYPDALVACHGFDYDPWPGAHSYVLLSEGPRFYRSSALPGDIEFSHRGAIGDINSDGKLDIVLAQFRKLSVYHNLGDGKFSNAKTLAKARGGINSVAAADLNGDGFDDLVVGGSENDSVGGNYPARVLWNEGSKGVSGKKQTRINKIKGYGIVLDYYATDNYLYVIRTRDGKGVGYTGGMVQKVDKRTLDTVSVLESTGPHPAGLQAIKFSGGQAFGSVSAYRRATDFIELASGEIKLLSSVESTEKADEMTQKVCKYAVVDGQWSTKSAAGFWVDEGKRRGINPNDCK